MKQAIYRMMQVVLTTLALTLALVLPAEASVQCKAGLTPHTYANGETRCVRQCKGKTKTGTRCTHTVGVNKQGFCPQHNPLRPAPTK